jgi:uncharacterized protein YbjT (DUF2867 family)
MKLVLFGGSGMVGQAALRVCLRDVQVSEVISIVRTPAGQSRAKLREIVHKDFLDFSPIQNELGGCSACIWCLGVTSSGLSEEEYNRITCEFTLAAAKTLLAANPGMSFVFVSGAGADSSERGRLMWARVKGKTENALLAMPFRAVYIFRPAMIEPLDGIESKTPSYRLGYKYGWPLFRLLRWVAPRFVTTTAELGDALVAAATVGTEKRIVEAGEIRTVRDSLRGNS